MLVNPNSAKEQVQFFFKGKLVYRAFARNISYRFIYRALSIIKTAGKHACRFCAHYTSSFLHLRGLVFVTS